MSGIRKDLTGKEFGKWKVIERAENDKLNKTQWLCECQCEKKTRKIILANSLVSGKSKSCGCYKTEKQIELNKNIKKKYNTYDLTSGYGIGFTYKGEKFYFDLEDYEKIKDYCWHIHKGYIVTNDKNNKFLSMHRLLMDFPENEVIDHINRNKNDNRKSNLKICEHQKNMLNQNVRKNNTSGVVGVTWDTSKEKWHSYIMVDGKLKHLGFFTNINDAIYIRLKSEKINGYSGQNKKLWKEYGIE
jgi:hypothetical protein